MWWLSVLPPDTTWWAGDCWSNCVPATDNSPTLSWGLQRFSSFAFVMPNVPLFSDALPKEVFILSWSLRSEFPDTLITSRPEDAFIDLIANSILGAMMLSIATRIAFCILSSTVSTILLISLSIFSLKHLSKVFTFNAFSLTIELTLEVPPVKFWSSTPPLTTTFSRLSLVVLPMITSWSKSSNWLRSLLLDCLFFLVETMFV